ncbi:hypothetical protein SPRG_19166 [Saprolegnia parasitica CBS 223.65]|uniref:HSF-type DNA-binding domain-containing protein n=1 Tax=Saprolegnia parasitica (strain CBS 223.65) TaxID=695850 RepID=A0A067D3C6_SAPPC|nr:hypothetical protein SPRG_19166 [Saprolegnia parasitica CBS 223.65]KDO33532.1 hypothetical protein SPRG_19166 [Saprolegnia parasitica CBS 223.65]|eukprot:XP_012195593.1 hypothetical protein SPRG_19166 [Saprolegnia parasitica CBS 223.65]
MPLKRVRVEAEAAPVLGPVFLQKIFRLFSETPRHIAHWGRDGRTVRIEDPHRFALDVLPLYFNHSNFLSFVRQLNFYGFRKYKPEDGLSHLPSEKASYAWEFIHDRFQRSMPELVATIRRNGHVAPTNNDATPRAETLPALQMQVQELQRNSQDMVARITALTSLLSEFVRDQQDRPVPPSRKRATHKHQKNSGVYDPCGRY